MRDYREFLGEVLIPEDKLQARIAELGAQISRDYVGKDPILVCILRGGVLFLTDLMRKITIPHSIEFMAVSSYGVGGRQSSGRCEFRLTSTWIFRIGMSFWWKTLLTADTRLRRYTICLPRVNLPVFVCARCWTRRTAEKCPLL